MPPVYDFTDAFKSAFVNYNETPKALEKQFSAGLCSVLSGVYVNVFDNPTPFDYVDKGPKVLVNAGGHSIRFGSFTNGIVGGQKQLHDNMFSADPEKQGVPGVFRDSLKCVYVVDFGDREVSDAEITSFFGELKDFIDNAGLGIEQHPASRTRFLQRALTIKEANALCALLRSYWAGVWAQPAPVIA
jgi:hypothetical protein